MTAIPGKVAIWLATRNGAAFLDEQLRSLEAQTHPSIDIWASDDGSTVFAGARKSSFVAAMASLRRSSVYRQTPQGTLALWAAFALGLM